MNDFEKAKLVINLMMEMHYIEDDVKPFKIRLDENDDIDIILISPEPNDHVVVTREIWDIGTEEVFRAWINLLIEAEKEQNQLNDSLWFDLSDMHKEQVARIYDEIQEGGMYSNCEEDTLYYRAQLDLMQDCLILILKTKII